MTQLERAPSLVAPHSWPVHGAAERRSDSIYARALRCVLVIALCNLPLGARAADPTPPSGETPVAPGMPAAGTPAPGTAAPGTAAPGSPAPSPPAVDSARGPVRSEDDKARSQYEFQSGTVCPFCAITPQYPEGRSGLHWHDHWKPVGTAEYIGISAMAATILGMRLFINPPSNADWDKEILFDGAVRDALRIDSPSGRDTAAVVSDVLFVWELLHPAVIDPFLVAWWQRKSPYVAWQMFVIDAQAYGLTLLVNDLTKRLTSRARPWVSTDDCAVNPDGESCGSGGRYQAFYSGHAAVTATGAGLLCAHHTQLSLYQNDLLDSGTCLLAVAGTAVTGAMRIASDNHWASDVVIGHLAGYVSGYLLPTLIYYREFRTAPHDHPPEGPTFAALPLATDGALGLSVFGTF